MKGICLFYLQPRERPLGARPYGASWRLTPECELFEWALLDANKSGTAEAVWPSSLLVETKAFSSSPPLSPTKRRIRGHPTMKGMDPRHEKLQQVPPGILHAPGTLPGLDAEGAPHPAPPMVQRRPAGRQPGPHHPHEPGGETGVLPPAAGGGL